MAADLRRVQPGTERSETAKRRCAFCPKGSAGGHWQLVALDVERRMEAREVIRILDARPPTDPRYSPPPPRRRPRAVACRHISAVTTGLSSSRWPCRNGLRGVDSKTLYSNPAVLAERLQRKLQQPVSGRVPQSRGLCFRAGNQSARQGTPAAIPIKPARTPRWTTRRPWSSRSAALRQPITSDHLSTR